MRSLLVVVLGVLAPDIARGACAPEKMVRIVFRDATPGIEPGSFAAQPKTLFRLGARYSRLEESLDSEHGIHGLLISAEPDSWMINLAAKSGQHILDRSEPYIVHVSIFGSASDPETLRSFEFGCELAYMKGKGVAPEAVTISGRKLDMYVVSEASHRLLLAVISGTERPFYVAHSVDGKSVRLYQYVQYDQGLEPDPRLFTPPLGIELTEAK
jgi:hypothetical protein